MRIRVDCQHRKERDGATTNERLARPSRQAAQPHRVEPQIAPQPHLAPPCGNRAALFLNVMARARRVHSSNDTSAAMRSPPLAGPHATLSITNMSYFMHCALLLSVPMETARGKLTAIQSDWRFADSHPKREAIDQQVASKTHRQDHRHIGDG